MPQPLTKKQLGKVVAQYAATFPDWQLLDSVGFFREEGPIRQQIAFEKLRSGAYRPTHGIRALPLPTSRMLFQHLDVRHRETLLRQHEFRWRDVLRAMEEQFKPSIRKPIDLTEVLHLCEAEAIDTTNDWAMLAILHAYIGNRNEAIKCNRRMEAAPMPSIAPRLDWERRHIDFARQLTEAIQAGNERQFLKEASKSGN